MSEQSFDYIVIGAGTSGSVIANRLSERPDVRVLVIEGGEPDRNMWVRIPLGIGKLLLDPSCLWVTPTDPEPGLNGLSMRLLGGRIWGGSSSVNGMLAVRGHPARYDEWRDLGCEGWGYDDVQPYFKRLETAAVGKDDDRGRSGPVAITEGQPDLLGAALIDSCVSAGYRRAADYNGPDSEGTAPAQFNIRSGRRHSAATAYLRPAARRNNLTIVSNAIAERVLLEGSRATGVQYRIGDETRIAHGRKGVVVCAGTLRSPQLLELSGIGNPRILQAQGIAVTHNLPGVGENLQDHLFGRVCYECSQPVTINDLLRSRWRMLRELAVYAVARKGMLSNPSYTAISFLRSTPDLPYPDVRIQLAIVSGQRRLSKNLQDGLDPFSGFIIGGYPIYPKSRGSVHVKTGDAKEPPRVQANYLTDPEDCARAVKVLQTIRRIAGEPELQRYIVREVRPGPAITAESDLLDYFRNNGETSWHMCGTCRMGSGPDAVVDNRLRVRGIERLYVADASIFPIMVSSNTHIPALMLGEKASDLIAADS